ncbi:MAG: hypothetical protein AAGI14_01665 [Pseudomonadota bacterium]
MSDKIFFPLVFMVGVAMVLATLFLGRETEPTGPIGGAASGDYSVVPIEGENFKRLEGLALGAISSVEDGILTLSTGPRPQPAQVTVGPHFKLAADLETVYSGHSIQIFVQAQSVSGADLEINYDTGRQGESGWQRFDLTEDWQEYRFDYNVPLRAEGSESGFDYLGLRPVGETLPGVVRIRKIEFRRRGLWAQ